MVHHTSTKHRIRDYTFWLTLGLGGACLATALLGGIAFVSTAISGGG